MPPADEQTRQPIKDGPWLHAWHNQLANIHCLEGCFQLSTLYVDDEGRLLAACRDRYLRVFKDKALVSEVNLPDTPVAIRVVRPSRESDTPPYLAVAAGPYVYMYRNLRAFFKFTVPEVTLCDAERGLWTQLSQNAMTADLTAVVDELAALRDTGVCLSSRSLDLLACEDDSLRRDLVLSVQSSPLRQDTCITCMEVIPSVLNDPHSTTSLIVGTESGLILLLEPSASRIRTQLELGAVPVKICVTGELDVEWRAVVSCRDGKLYTITNGDAKGSAVVRRPAIELESQPSALARTEKYIYAATMDHQLTCFSLKGRKHFSLKLPAGVTCLEPITLQNQRLHNVIIAALTNGEVRVYRDKSLVHSLKVDDVVTALAFGRYGREDHTLALVTKSGALTLKMLQRSAALEGDAKLGGPPAEQDTPLNIPKKTKLYIDQTQRERDNATEMHHIFQNDLCRLRLDTARAYVKLLTDGHLGESAAGTASVRMHAEVRGLGPLFKLCLTLTNAGQKPLHQVGVAVKYDESMYHIERSSDFIPLLLPGVARVWSVKLTCVNPEAQAGTLQVLLSDVNGDTGNIPYLSAVVNMPQSEV